MTKEEYMEQLRKKLKKLPQEDFNKALDYFEEYFAEAGEENAAQAIEDLGAPKVAAENIIMEFAIGNSVSQDAKKDVRKGIRGVWVVILAIFASPIALPIVVALVAVLLMLVISVLMVLISIGLTGVALVLSAIIVFLSGFTMVTQSLAVTLVCIGMGLLMLALGVLAVYASYLLIRKFLYWIVLSFGRRMAKGGKENENE